MQRIEKIGVNMIIPTRDHLPWKFSSFELLVWSRENEVWASWGGVIDEIVSSLLFDILFWVSTSIASVIGDLSNIDIDSDVHSDGNISETRRIMTIIEDMDKSVFFMVILQVDAEYYVVNVIMC